MEVAEAYALISRAIDAGRQAHGYLIVGDVHGNCLELVRMVLLKLFPDGRELISSRSHPDGPKAPESRSSRSVLLSLTAPPPSLPCTIRRGLPRR